MVTSALYETLRDSDRLVAKRQRRRNVFHLDQCGGLGQVSFGQITGEVKAALGFYQTLFQCDALSEQGESRPRVPHFVHHVRLVDVGC